MRIVHVTECLAGGVLTFLLNLTSQLDQDEHIIIYGKRDNTPDNVELLFKKNVSLIYWKNAQREIRPKQDLLALRELLYRLKNIENIDILQLHSSKAGVLGRVAARLLGLQKRTFYLPHGVSFARQDVSSRKRNFYILIEKVANAFAGRVIACSHSEKELLISHGIKNVTVINNGIKVSEVEPKYKIPGRPLVFGTVGRITYQKNPKLFNEIAVHFKEDKRVRFLWIGDGELRHEIQENEQVQVTGWVTPSEVQSYLNQIDIYISTSLWEGLPLSVLEAMNCGKPLLLSDCVGNVDTVKDGDNGFLYHDVEDAVDLIEKFLLIPTESVLKLEKKSYQMVCNNFSLRLLKNAYESLYKTIVLKKIGKM
ncbi:glycosyltransferase [Megasphaera sp.]|uniref:glycosyltransferase n=1 Tax=Megasphaera sp. TaxID=2023260 RepID=UPI0040293343